MLLGVVLAVVFGYLAIRGVDYGRFRSGLAESNYQWLVPALAALAFGVWLRAVRWRLLFAEATRPPLWAVTNALLIGYFFNQLLPARAGEAARVVSLHQASDTSRAEAAGTAVAERIYDVVSLLILLFAAAPFVPSVGWMRKAVVVAAVVLILLLALIVCVLRYRERPLAFLLRPLARLPRASRERTDAVAIRIVDGLAALHRPRLAVPALAATFLSWLVLALSFWCCLRAFDLHVGYGAGILVVVATNLALVIPSAPAAVGVFEAAVVLALDPYHVGRSEALAAAVVLHALNLFPFLLAGAWALSRHAAAVRQQTQAKLAG
jgi:uncharacterized protein (TIRG00374 family)